MLLQTNSYIVPKDRRAEHQRLVRKFRQVLARLGCDQFEVYEQVGANWSSAEATGRYVQIMRFRDRKHQLAVQRQLEDAFVSMALSSLYGRPGPEWERIGSPGPLGPPQIGRAHV